LTRLRRLTWFTLAGFFLLLPRFGGSAAAQAGSADPPDRFKEWLAAIDAHQPRDPGKDAVFVSTWEGRELDAVIATAKRYARQVAKEDPDKANQMLLRGAALHADIARLIPDDMRRRSDRQLVVYAVKDGRYEGVLYPSIHWQLGRSLLDAIVPEPAAHPGVRTWYRETSEDLLRLRSLVEAQQHLARGLQIFPRDGLLLFYTGALHERYSSAQLQAGSASLDDANRGVSAIGSTHAELMRAERFFREALTYEPEHIEARLRHGSVLSELGHHDEALGELKRVVQAAPKRDLLYFAHLFIARSLEALGRNDDALLALEAAAALYPNAQTPRLAMSQIARRMGNRGAARMQLELLAGLPDVERQREDPWWNYYDIR
jgi:tetratricopeptide (TPR) repeat protein